MVCSLFLSLSLRPCTPPKAGLLQGRVDRRSGASNTAEEVDDLPGQLQEDVLQGGSMAPQPAAGVGVDRTVGEQSDLEDAVRFYAGWAAVILRQPKLLRGRQFEILPKNQNEKSA